MPVKLVSVKGERGYLAEKRHKWKSTRFLGRRIEIAPTLRSRATRGVVCLDSAAIEQNEKYH